jgi:uncharacterized protein
MPMRNPVVWFEIYVHDMARAKRFYEAVLGVTLSRLELPDGDAGLEMQAFPMSMEGGGASGSLVKVDGFTPSGNGTLVYFECEDCDVEASRVEGAGGKVSRPKMSIGQYGFIALAVDTEGNTIGLHSIR